MHFNTKEIGLRIAKLRIQHGYTQERLADALNIDRTHLSKIEAGKRSCSIDLFVQLSAFFDVSLVNFGDRATSARTFSHTFTVKQPHRHRGQPQG